MVKNAQTCLKKAVVPWFATAALFLLTCRGLRAVCSRMRPSPAKPWELTRSASSGIPVASAERKLPLSSAALGSTSFAASQAAAGGPETTTATAGKKPKKDKAEKAAKAEQASSVNSAVPQVAQGPPGYNNNNSMYGQQGGMMNSGYGGGMASRYGMGGYGGSSMYGGGGMYGGGMYGASGYGMG
jgi:peroxin-13